MCQSDVAAMFAGMHRSPSDASLLCDQSAALLKLGKCDEALQAARAAAALRPRWAKAHLSIGRALAATDHMPEACSALRWLTYGTIVALIPKLTSNLANLRIVASQACRPSAARLARRR